MVYLSVIKDENDSFVINKTYQDGTNVYGNLTGSLWHRAEHMTLQQRIDEGIYLKVTRTQGYDPEYSYCIRVDVVYDEERAEVVYTEIYEMYELDYIKESLMQKTHAQCVEKMTTELVFKDEKFLLDPTQMATLNCYSSVYNQGGSLPAGAVLHSNHCSSTPLTPELLLEVQTFIAEYVTSVHTECAEKCHNIHNAETYEDAKSAFYA